MMKSIKKRSLIYSIFLSFFLTILVVAIPVSAKTNYNVGFQENQEVEYVVTLVDKSELKDIFGKDFKDSFGDNAHQEGAKMKIRIDEIDEEVRNRWFTVTIDVWDWVDPDYAFDSEPTREEWDYSTYKTPSKYDNATVSDTGFFYVPTPVVSYLDDVDWDTNWKAKTNTIELKNRDKEKYINVWTYDENSGLLSKYEILNNRDKPVYRYEQQQLILIPNYELPILLAIFALSAIGIILYVKKKGGEKVIKN